MTFDPVLIGSSEDPYRFGTPVHIVPAARRRHLALFGASGSGKSSLMRNMLAEDILAGHGVTVVDPHGQLVEDILETISRASGRMTLSISIPRIGPTLLP